MENTDRLGEAGGFSVLLEALESDPCDPELQAHGCVVLCELASRDDVSPVEIKECLDILLDRLQQFRDDREVRRGGNEDDGSCDKKEMGDGLGPPCYLCVFILSTNTVRTHVKSSLIPFKQ